MPDAFRETYLGDGLYASFDGYMIRLRAPRLGGDHFVGLEPEILAAFEEYVAWVREKIARERAATKADAPLWLDSGTKG